MAGFSSVIRLADLDDFIAPSQECVKPVQVQKTSGGTAKIKITDDGSYHQVTESGEVKRLQPASVSLSDCLACSGCVTSAETVLIEQQSERLLLQQLQHERHLPADGAGDAAQRRVFVATVAPQAVASFATELGVDSRTAAGHLSGWLRQLGVNFVFDLAVARQLAWQHLAEDFLVRLQAVDAGAPGNAQPLPLLSSSCPGFVCYAEKTHGAFILPHVSRVKSPQQLAGQLIKGAWCRRHSVAPRNVFHFSVMPCFDKKLEAVRPTAVVQDSVVDGAAPTEVDSGSEDAQMQVREVDCVVTPVELARLLRQHHGSLDEWASSEAGGDGNGGGASDHGSGSKREPTTTVTEHSDSAATSACLTDFPVAPFDRLMPAAPALSTPAGSGSGGAALYVLRAAGRRLNAVDPGAHVTFSASGGRNADLLEAELTRADGRPPLRFAVANGFRNVQNVVQRMKRGRCRYDFVEVMACPGGGCVNGGAVLRPPPELDAAKQRLAAVRAAYDSLHDADEDQQAAELASQVDVDSTAVFTEYHAVQSEASSLNIKW